MQIIFQAPSEFLDLLSEVRGPAKELAKKVKNLEKILDEERGHKHALWKELHDAKTDLSSTENELDTAKKFIDEFQESLIKSNNKISFLEENLSLAQSKNPTGEKAFLLHGNLFRMSKTNAKYYGWNKGAYRRVYYSFSALKKNPEAQLVYLTFGDSREN